MSYLIIFVVAVLAGIGYIRATNLRIEEDVKVPELDEFGNETGAFIVKGAEHMPKYVAAIVVATIVAITELVGLFAGEWYVIGMIIAVVAVLGLAIFQFAMATKRQIRAIIGVAFAVGVAATMCKAGKFDAFQIYSEGFKSISSLLITLLVPIIVVGVCGLVQRFRLSGGVFGHFVPIKTNNNDETEDDEEEVEEEAEEETETETEGERTPNDSGALIKMLLPYVALLLGLVLIGIGTYAAVTFIKGGLM